MTPLALRPARNADAEEAAQILVASITELCHADHRGEPELIAAWTANKTPDAVAAMIAAGGMLVAEAMDRIVGVGQADHRRGRVTLLYVAPEVRDAGVSTALLAALEQALASAGIETARLETTETARAFYLARGWRDTADADVLAKRLTT